MCQKLDILPVISSSKKQTKIRYGPAIVLIFVSPQNSYVKFEFTEVMRSLGHNAHEWN